MRADKTTLMDNDLTPRKSRIFKIDFLTMFLLLSIVFFTYTVVNQYKNPYPSEEEAQIQALIESLKKHPVIEKVSHRRRGSSDFWNIFFKIDNNGAVKKPTASQLCDAVRQSEDFRNFDHTVLIFHIRLESASSYNRGAQIPILSKTVKCSNLSL